MSHFTTMIKIPNKEVEELGFEEALARKLAPYQEGDCPEEYLTFNDIEDESFKEWNEDSTDMIRMPDGSLLWPWDDQFKVKSTDPFSRETKLPPGLKEEKIPLKEKYPTFKLFMEDYHGHEKGPDEKTGRYGYWHNPNAKWDWFAVGGRWMGELRLKNALSATAKKSSQTPRKGSSTYSNGFDDDPLTADAAQYKDIDWEGLNAQVDATIEDFYKEVETLRRLEAKPESQWTKEEQSQHSHLMFGVRSRLCDIGLVNRDAEGKYASIKDFTLEDLKRDYREEWGFRTFAAIDENGKWHEKGSMGWFGCHSGTEDDAIAWAKGFKKNLLGNTAPDTWIAVVDCHI